MPNYVKNLIAATVLAICAGVYFLYGEWIRVNVDAGAKVKLNLNIDFLPDKNTTGSPFFQVSGNELGEGGLPLKSTDVTVTIAGVIADVEVRQSYRNTSSNNLEAIYVFPASTNAAVYALEMKVGDRITHAKILEKKSARQVYQKAKKEGKSASLLEQQRPNVFKMNVANIRPDEEVEVVMHYTELLVPTEGTYEFVYPTVVAPRYEGTVAEDGWVNNPYMEEDGTAADRKGLFNINVTVEGGMPIQRLQSTSHEVNVDYLGANTAQIALKDDFIVSEKDYILQYQLKGKAIESGLLLYEGAEENFFLAMVQPPQQVELTDIPPREYVFIMDVSGSMEGEPLAISKQLMTNLLAELRPEDRFNVLLFEYGNKLLFPKSKPATAENLTLATKLIDSEHSGGGTELLPALKMALALEAEQKESRSFIIITDGHITVEKEVFDLVRNRLGEANFFAFGIGTSINRYLIEGLGRVGKTEPLMITKMSEAKEKAEDFRKYISAPVLSGIQISFDGLDTDVQQIPDVFAERPLILFGKYKGEAKGKIKIKGYTGLKNTYRQEINLDEIKPDEKLQALRYLWARNQIKLLGDYENLSYKNDHEEEITQLGLKYNLLTDYTSFVAVDDAYSDKVNADVSIGGEFELGFGDEEGMKYQFNNRGGIVSGSNEELDQKGREVEVMYLDLDKAREKKKRELSKADKKAYEKKVKKKDVLRQQFKVGLPTIEQAHNEMNTHILEASYTGNDVLVESIDYQLLKNTVISSMLNGIEALPKSKQFPQLQVMITPSNSDQNQKAMLFGKSLIRMGMASAFRQQATARKLYAQTLELGKQLGLPSSILSKDMANKLAETSKAKVLNDFVENITDALALVPASKSKQQLVRLIIIGAWNEYYLNLIRLNDQNKELEEQLAQRLSLTAAVYEMVDKTGNSKLAKDLSNLYTLYQKYKID